MEQLTDLDLFGNAIRDISELGALVNLIRLNVSSNDIYRIDSLKELNKLQCLNLSNNKILFCEPIKDLSVKELQLNDNFILNDLELIANMKHMNLQWVQFCYKQRNAPLSDYRNYLGANAGTVEAAQKLMDQYQEQRSKTIIITHDKVMNAIYTLLHNKYQLQLSSRCTYTQTDQYRFYIIILQGQIHLMVVTYSTSIVQQLLKCLKYFRKLLDLGSSLQQTWTGVYSCQNQPLT
ncbi:leucine-rich_repeat domain-containing protein [Hexamita inflata]|uniref:Leucine-rich repeat domain-containing protein n=1 Tax=Hexamita inflata TaxID=28002 RepID=A0AA86R9P7_9EUKA|nr:leucine-rich repeat domain-containing protein [Hexamita inflata]